MVNITDIRKAFLDYFVRHGHEVIQSGPLVPLDDPSLLFTNAGMVQFKNYFTGKEISPFDCAVTSQKCVRAGGKHNDLDNVGYTSRHHTFFEMLGNFSFGYYFKEKAIYYAWSFLTQELGIDAEKLLITVHTADDEAFTFWRKVSGFNENRIIRISTSDNFWSMGDRGPCGPCSEIFYDHGEDVIGGMPGSSDADGDRFTEIWNLVFMQFEQYPDGTRIDLPKPSIDTGMGLERLGAVLQGKQNNYDTDLFRYLIEYLACLSGQSPEGRFMASYRVIADHLRSASFLIADGVLPSNEGRGYVLRRIMRRAMRHAQLLGVEEPFLWRGFPALQEQMGEAFPELNRAGALITETLKYEEERFRRTLSRGLCLLEDEIKHLTGTELSGDIAFKLYDTYGFPLDLTQDALRERGLTVDEVGFNDAMDVQKKNARNHWAGSGDNPIEDVWFNLKEEMGATEFVGYQSEESEAIIQAIIVNHQRIESIQKGSEALILMNQTPFYAESGGQIGDTGKIINDRGDVMTVLATRKEAGNLHIHSVLVEQGKFSLGDHVILAIAPTRRRNIKANHSATHLLHEALRCVLGNHVTQKGSLVEEDYLRFDFSHSKSMTHEEISLVENRVNAVILNNEDVMTRIMTPEEAIEAGALALFGEKYDHEVRVLFMGSGTQKEYYSVELCGGTHVNRLGDIGLFKITHEGAVASGVRRIEAKTADAARHFLQQQAYYAQEVAQILKSTPSDLPVRVAHLLEERKRLERDLSEAKKKLAMGGGEHSYSLDDVKNIGNIKFLGRILQDISAKELRGLVDAGKQKIGSGVVSFIAIDGDKAGIAVGVTDDLTDQYDAVTLVRLGAEFLGGTGGGGRKDMAQAGGSDVSYPQKALDAVMKGLEV